jgi:capsule polysaccharide export protein KpsE/RkpR
MTDTIAVSDAQQRRKFFEQELRQTQNKLVQAQQALQASGFTQGALKAEPKSAAEGYARLRAEVTAAEVRLQTLRGSLSDATPEVQQQQNALVALRGQLSRLEQTADARGGPDYVGKYREFKYQETLFDLFAKQYELARVDESREGALIQVVDPATPPEKKSKPKRAIVALAATLLSGLTLAGFVLVRRAWRAGTEDPANANRMARLRQALGRRQP